MVGLGELVKVLGAKVIAPDVLSVKSNINRSDIDRIAATAEASSGRTLNHTAGFAQELCDVEHDSRRVTEGSLFACIPGLQSDGHDYAQAAIDAGARALLVQNVIPNCVVPQLLVASVRRALGLAAAAVYEHPSKKTDLVGVTGTNGKTTTVRIIASLLVSAGFGVCEIGTLTGVRTTPEASELQRLIATSVDEGNRSVVMEVSSHALSQHRVDACTFRVVVFTNLGHDHLDYHKTSEAYFMAKAKLFDPEKAERAIINTTTEAGQRLVRIAESRLLPITEINENSMQIIRIGVRSSLFEWRDELVHLPLGGAFNVVNAVTAAETAVLLGLSSRFIVEALADVPQIPGRFESVELPVSRTGSAYMNQDLAVEEAQFNSGQRDRSENAEKSNDKPLRSTALTSEANDPIRNTRENFRVIVDYAHTPEGIESVLKAARAVTEGRLMIVFGAGGDRDHVKRPVMGRVAEKLADLVVLTNDNPRSEAPQLIIADITEGMSGSPDLIETDRRLAIRYALTEADSGDVIVIAGKGHENVQIIGCEEYEFDDRQVTQDELLRLHDLRAANNSSTTSR